jgi:hypothetical protein
MNAAEALEAARAAGIQIKIDDDLLPKASAPPPPGVLDGLSRHKARILNPNGSSPGSAGEAAKV